MAMPSRPLSQGGFQIFPLEKQGRFNGTEVKALVVQYEGEQVPFSYQLWQIKQNSVCRPYEQDVRRFS